MIENIEIKQQPTDEQYHKDEQDCINKGTAGLYCITMDRYKDLSFSDKPRYTLYTDCESQTVMLLFGL